MGKVSPEHLIQCQIIERVRFELADQFPILKGPTFEEDGAVRLFAVPNGDIRHISAATRLKLEGVSSGVPDLCLPIPAGGFHGLWIEVKTPTGTVSKTQKDWIQFLIAVGYRVEVVRSHDRAIQILREYLLTRGPG